MRFHPTRVPLLLLCLVSICVTLIISCTKDSDILGDAIFDDPVQTVEEREGNEEAEEEAEEETPEEETPEEETPEEETPEEVVLESRVSSFLPSHDAYVQNGSGFNQSVMRLDTDTRTSYMLFDLSAIDSIGGNITEVTLEFTVNTDPGNGEIKIYKGHDVEWTEDNISDETAPDIDVELGSINKEYELGATEVVTLSSEEISPAETTLILEHEAGNDLAFASKEHPSVEGPKLIVSYDAPEGAEDIGESTQPGGGGESGSGGEGETPSENQAPVAVISASTTSGQAPLTVSFASSNSTDDKGITGRSWDFKDGETSTSTNPQHTFTDAGTYQVSFTATDAEGLEDTATVTITVGSTQNEAPVAVANADPVIGDAPLDVQFLSNSSSDDQGITAYLWDFDNGLSTSNQNPSTTFNDPGVYEVSLTVTDAQGLSSTDNITITVNEGSGGGGSGSGGGGGSNGTYPPGALYASSLGFNSSDATLTLERAFTSSSSFIVVDKQASDWVVGPLNFNNLHNKTIVFEAGVVLRAKSGAFPNTSHRLLQFMNSSNIEIRGYGATFQMNKSEYTSGEHRHTLSLIASTDITIRGLTLKDSGGDGIYVSRLNTSQYCRNVLIEDVVASNHKRQGISVISVDGLTVRNSTFTGTIGKAPGAGVDFEPEATADRLTNITFENCSFTNNFGPGILFALQNQSSNSAPISATFRNCYVSNNFSTSNPGVYPTEIDLGMSTLHRYNPVKGSITFDGLTVENSRWSGIWSKKTLEAYSVTVRNAVIRNVSQASDLAAIHIGILDYANTSTANMGGFTFENVLIDYDGVDPSLELFGPSHGSWNLRNLYGQVRVRSPRGIQFSDNLNKLSIPNSTVTLTVVAD